MDWIEEKVGKLHGKIKDARLHRSLLYAILLWLIIAIIVSIVARNVCYSWIGVLIERYPVLKDMEDMIFLNAIISDVPIHVQISFAVLKFMCRYGILVYAIIAEYIGIRAFYKSKVEPGIRAVYSALTYMCLGDLGHEQIYYDTDELGDVCNKAEELRKKLIAKKRQEWEIQAEQESINAAFAHDIRTPLTVMKGYTEFLLKYQPEGKVTHESLIEKLQIMKQQQERLLEFSKTMTEIQKIEMRELHCKHISISSITSKLQGTLDELKRQSGKEVKMTYLGCDAEKKDVLLLEKIIVDEDLMMEVCENLLSNAFRYAKKCVDVKISLEENRILIYIQDDGSGFSFHALKEAKSLYWSEEKGTNSHFGMGLYICDKLCEKHGGNLSFTNGIDGGAIVAAEFKIDQ